MVAPLTRLKQAGQYLYLTFTLRRMLLVTIVVLGVLPGAVLFSLPMTIKVIYTIGFVTLTAVAFHCFWGVYSRIAEQNIRMAWADKKYKRIPYYTDEIKELAKKMGIKQRIDVYVTENPHITSAFTNMFTCRIGIPAAWITQFPSIERRVIIAHELGHIKTRQIFFAEFLGSVAVIMAFTYLFLMVYTIQFFGQIAQMALGMILLSLLSRRNEFRADKEAAKAVSPEALISVFEQFVVNGKRDDGSETHPSFRARIKRLGKLMNE
jgi:Zn-dependent protease with chaperone function